MTSSIEDVIGRLKSAFESMSELEEGINHDLCAPDGLVLVEIEKLRADGLALLTAYARSQEALKVSEQALMEVAHAQTHGAKWYTKGEVGIYSHVRMWVEKGLTAIRASLAFHSDGGESSQPTPSVEGRGS